MQPANEEHLDLAQPVARIPRGSLVLLLDDDEGLREAFTWMFESEDIDFKGFSNFEMFQKVLFKYLEGKKSLCLLLDLRMPSISGLEVFEWIKQQGVSLSRLPIIFLTGHGDISTAVETVKNGAFDFYEKPATDHRLINRVRQALSLSSDFLDQQDNMRCWINRINKLSPREREVMFLVAKGKLNKVIASELDISLRTVEVHRSNLFEKLRVRSAAELATLLSDISSRLGFV